MERHRDGTGMLKECCRNGIGMRMDGGTGMEREWCRNGMGMAQEWNGAGMFPFPNSDFKKDSLIVAQELPRNGTGMIQNGTGMVQ